MKIFATCVEVCHINLKLTQKAMNINISAKLRTISSVKKKRIIQKQIKNNIVKFLRRKNMAFTLLQVTIFLKFFYYFVTGLIFEIIVKIEQEEKRA